MLRVAVLTLVDHDRIVDLDVGQSVPDGGPAIGNLRRTLDVTVTEEQRAAFAGA